jgi:acyl-coenzyme A thioesterase 13
MPAPYGDSPGHWEFLESSEGKARMSWAPTPDMANPFGSVHGGIIATVIDESCGAALMPSIETPSAPTVSLNVEYLHPVPIGGDYEVLSEIVRRGRAMAIVDSRIVNEEGTMLVRGTAFFQIPRPK